MAAGPIGEPGARMSVIVADARPQLIAARLAEPEGLAPSLMRLRAGDGVVFYPLLANIVHDKVLGTLRVAARICSVLHLGLHQRVRPATVL
jgi:hypothetical protein